MSFDREKFEDITTEILELDFDDELNCFITTYKGGSSHFINENLVNYNDLIYVETYSKNNQNKKHRIKKSL